jgi:hypothetical protein
VIAVCLLGLAPTAPASAVARAAEPSCAQVLVVGVRGSGENADDVGGYGKTVASFVGRFRHAYGHAGQVAAIPLDYAAQGVFSLASVLDPSTFFGSVDNGIKSLEYLLTTRARQCPTEKIVLAGYSQGALVVNRALVELGEQKSRILERVASITLIADPQRIGTSASNLGDASHAFNGLGVATGVYPADELPAELIPRTDSMCTKGDVVCAYDSTRALPVITPAAFAKHTSYTPRTTALARRTAKRVNAFDTPTAPDTSEISVSFQHPYGSYTMQISFDITGVAFSPDIANSQPGRADAQLSGTGAITIHNTTPGRNLRFDLVEPMQVGVYWSKSTYGDVLGDCRQALVFLGEEYCMLGIYTFDVPNPYGEVSIGPDASLRMPLWKPASSGSSFLSGPSYPESSVPALTDLVNASPPDLYTVDGAGDLPTACSRHLALLDGTGRPLTTPDDGFLPTSCSELR